MKEAVTTYTSRAAEKLRQEQLAATIVSVFILTKRFNDDPRYQNSIQIMLPVATDDTAELIHYALQELEIPTRLPVPESRGDAAEPDASHPGAAPLI